MPDRISNLQSRKEDMLCPAQRTAQERRFRRMNTQLRSPRTILCKTEKGKGETHAVVYLRVFGDVPDPTEVGWEVAGDPFGAFELEAGRYWEDFCQDVRYRKVQRSGGLPIIHQMKVM